MQTTNVEKMKQKMLPVSPAVFCIVDSNEDEVLFEERVVKEVKKLFRALEGMESGYDTKKYKVQFIGSIRIKELKDK